MYIESTDSTNTRMRELIAAGNPPQFIYAGFQTAGRGQTGNGWESEEGKNLLCSILVESQKIKNKSPFYLNVAISVAVYRVLQSFVFEQSGLCSLGEAVSIKWPNDIYWQDKKVAGILIENAMIGNEINYSVAGIGLNVNQTDWKTDAPNPVSLRQITGQAYDIDVLMQKLYDEVQKALEEDVWDDYRAHLYRREGWWPFAEREVSIVPSRVLTERPEKMFLAQITEVTEQGELVLQTKEGTKKYHFKEIQFVL